MSRPFDPFSLEFEGRQLIEASAGTGKTWTITALVLRLLLGDGVRQPLTIDQILIVTFTRAATDELRNRLNRRLREALDGFARGSSDDEVVSRLLDRVDPGEAQRRLRAAILMIDQAAVFTIHGLCNRCLTELAFETGMLFEWQIDTDHDGTVRNVVADTYRGLLNELRGDRLTALRERFATPDALYREIKEPLLRPDIEVFSSADDALVEHCREQIGKARRLWVEDNIPGLLTGLGLPRNAAALASKRLQAFGRFAATDSSLIGKSGPLRECFKHWGRGALQARLKGGGRVPASEFFDAMEVLDLHCDAFMRGLTAQVLQQALDISRERMARQARPDRMGFDAMVRQLRDEVKQGHPALLQRFRERYPVAMVDEFQDTDPQQFEIFDGLYRGFGCLLMIGDPKQAIYAFRGADVHAYIHARRHAAQRHTLMVNHRSETALVEAVNRLFDVADPFLHGEDIPFVPVDAARDDQRRLEVNGEVQPAMSFWVHEDVESRGNSRLLLAELAARQTACLLESGRIVEADGTARALQPNQIAFLVRDRNDAQAVAEALARHGIKVARAAQSSVFESDTALDLAMLLRAVLSPQDDRALSRFSHLAPQHALQAGLSPQDERTLRSALATPLLQAGATEIARQRSSGDAAEEFAGKFIGYLDRWRQHGVLPMLADCALAKDARGKKGLDIDRNLLRMTDGERRLTDLRHLGELLHGYRGGAAMHATVHWLCERLAGRGAESRDEELLRLSSDQNLVQMVTMHNAKGLEYEVVMVPMAHFGRDSTEALHHQDSDDPQRPPQLRLDLARGEEAMATARRERLAEDLRLLYVAMTRARLAGFFGLGKLSGRGMNQVTFDGTAFGHLLGGDGSIEAALHDRLQDTRYCINPQPAVVPLADRAASQDPALKPPLRAPHIEDVVRLVSFSALTRDHRTMDSGPDPRLELGPGAADEGAEADETVSDLADDAGADDILPGAAREFPKGPGFGSMLHVLLEKLDFDFKEETIGKRLPSLLRRHGLQGQNREQREELISKLVPWLHGVGTTPLHPLSLCLDDLTTQQSRVEMEFHFRLGRRDAGPELGALLERHGYRPLDGDVGQGAGHTGVGAHFMKGVIDLTFEHEGRLYIADYKSNHLGTLAQDYRQASMAEAMKHHHYDLQLLIYTLALHRWLRGRRRDYDYQEHFGGAFYLFLRGMQGAGRGDQGIYLHQPSAEAIDDLDRLFG